MKMTTPDDNDSGNFSTFVQGSQNCLEYLMPILHYALGLRFGKVCEKRRKTQAKHEKNARKTTDMRFCPTHSVIQNHFLALGSR